MSDVATLPPDTAAALAASVDGARVTVIGAARSGLAAAKMLAARGAKVFLTENGPGSDGLRQSLRAAGAAYEFGGHTARALDADFVVISPGVPSTVPLVVKAEAQRTPVYSELEVASWFCRGPIVGITGSNGKTTTTSMIGHIVRRSGRPTVVGGNIGYPFADYVDAIDEATAVVLEVSSFQLDHTVTFHPHVAVLLNITPDHLDRYGGDFDRYAAAKFAITKAVTPADWFVYNHDDALVREFAERLAAERGLAPYGFSVDGEPARGAYVRDGRIVLALPDPGPDGTLQPHTPVTRHEDLMSTSDLALRGRHNLYNSLASAVVARAMEIRSDVVRESLTSFEGVPHRLESVRTVGGVAYINDSKATNVNAVWYALESFPTRQPDGPGVILIAGGRDKGNDYGPLQALVAEKVKGIVAIGEGAEAVERELGPYAPHLSRAGSMEDAIQYARLLAEPGDTVLLSPACASFDMFESYEDRGDTFKRLVQAL